MDREGTGQSDLIRVFQIFLGTDPVRDFQNFIGPRPVRGFQIFYLVLVSLEFLKMFILVPDQSVLVHGALISTTRPI